MKEIIVDVGFNQTRVALIEDKELAEVYIDLNEESRIAGNIYKGRVTNVLPGMQSAFVDIGLEKNAFIFVEDDEILKVGQQIIVQVVKEAIDTKGPRVTMHITLPGRLLVLMPSDDFVGISRRISSDDERVRLKEMASSFKPEKMGLIVRTSSIGCTKEDFATDVIFLVKLWETVLNRIKDTVAPSLVHKDLSLVYRTVRDLFNNDIDKLIINDKEQYEKILKILEILDLTEPQMKTRVEYYPMIDDLFDRYELEKKISRLASRKVWLKNKGYIVIDQTEALTAIDVNTGKFVGSSNFEDTVYLTNMEAAKEIAKQLRLRDIGGIIIIDFIDMNNKNHEDAVIEILKTTLKKDRTKTNVLGMTQLGLLEMTRKKVKERIETILLSACPYCDGEGKIPSNEMVARNIERGMIKILFETDAEAVLLEIGYDANADFIKALEERVSFLGKLHKKGIIVKLSTRLKAHEYVLRGCCADFENDKGCV